jgi:hypothetical protein
MPWRRECPRSTPRFPELTSRAVSTLALAAIVLTAYPAAHAQRDPARSAASYLRAVGTASLLRPSLASILADTVPRAHRPTYWPEDAVVGGTLAGIAVSSFALSACSNPDSGSTGPCWDNALLGALLEIGGGGTLGALAGGLIEKPQPDSITTLLGPLSGEAGAVQGPPFARLLMGTTARGPLQPLVLADTTDSIPRRIRPTQWKKGALIGGLTFGAATALLFAVVCSAGSEAETDCGGAPLTGFAVGVLPGAIVGALIGGQFPKPEEPADPERPSE